MAARKQPEKEKKKALSAEAKVFIVKCLAAFKRPSEVVDLVKDELDVVVTKQAVVKYNPTTVSGEKLSEKLKKIFEDERAAFIADVSNVGIAHQSFRLRELHDLYEQAKEDGKDVVAREHLELAEKIRGGYYTNRRELSGPKGGPIQHAGIPIEDWQKQAGARLAEAQESLSIFEEEK